MEKTITMTLTITDYIPSAGFVVAVLGVIGTFLLAGIAFHSVHNVTEALRRKNSLTSVNIAAQALKEFAADKEMQGVFYLIEYGQFRYCGTWSLRESKMEKPTDKLLRHFAAVALAWKKGFVTEDALRIVRY